MRDTSYPKLAPPLNDYLGGNWLWRGEVSRCSVGTIGNDGELGRSTDQAGLSHPPNAAAPLHSAECCASRRKPILSSRPVTELSLDRVLGRRWVRACPRTPHRRNLAPRGILGLWRWHLRPARCGDDPVEG